MFKELIKELRTRNNLTMRAFGETIGVSGATVSNYESGKKKPGPETLAKISEVYNVSKDWLMGEVSDIKDAVDDIKVNAEKAAGVEEQAIAAEIEAKKTVRKAGRKAKETVADAVNKAITSDEAVAAEIEVKKALRKAGRKAKEAAEPIAKAAKKALAPEIIIESMMGGQISTSEILERLPKGATTVYVKPEENKAYFPTEDGVGSIDLW